MTFYENVKSILLSEIKGMADSPWLFAKNPLVHFSRKRKLDLETLLQVIISMEGNTIKHELLKHFDFDVETPSQSAFYQQRCKLHPDSLPYLSKQFLSHFPSELYREKYQLIAVDGCEFYTPRNPDDLDSYNPPCGRSERGFNQIQVNAFFDLLNRRYLDVITRPCRKKNEYRAFCDLADRYDKKGGIPIIIGDRGFSSYNCYAHAIENDMFFLIRTKDLNTKRLLGIDSLDEPDEFDYNIHRILTRTNNKKKWAQPNNKELYRFISKDTTFDYIEHGSAKEYHINLRVVRFEITESTYENIVTNLPPEEFSVNEIKVLYGLRWGIENSFRDLKYAVGAVNFHSINRELIEQEIWARIILYNFCSIITANVIVEKKDTKHVYQVNYSMAIKICHHFLRISIGIPPPDVEALIGRCTLPIRPGRKYKRHNRIRRPASFLYRFS